MRVGIWSGVLCLCLVSLSQAQNAHASIRRDTNIPAEELGSALQTLAKDYDFQVLYRTEIVRDLKTRGAAGSLTPDEALQAVLAGTGLSYKYLDAGTVTIIRAVNAAAAVPQAQAGPPGNSKEVGKSSSQNFRVAQAANQPATGVAALEQRGANLEGTGALEEVIVTAQKREQRLLDVPISIVAVSADELAKRSITNIDDLSLAVPGLSIQSSGSFQRQIVLRGVSNIFGTSSLVGIYLDEADVTSAGGNQLDLQTYDLERVEVLRGPQGTLYGEGSAGGTVRFITKNPQLDRFSMSADVAALFTENGAPSQRIRAVVNVPLIDNVLGLRIAGTFDHEGGWMNQPAAGVEDFNSQNLTEVRTKALWQPTSQFALNAMAVVHRNSAPPNVGEDQYGNYTQVFNFTTTPRGEDDFELYNLTGTYDFDVAKLVATGSYIRQNKSFEYLGFRYQLTPPGTPPYGQYVLSRPHDDTIYNGEIRLASSGPSPWQWTVGVFGRHATDEEITTEIFDLPGSAGVPVNDPADGLSPDTFVSPTSALAKSWAVFADTSYKLFDRLTLGSGLRYYRDEEENPLDGQTADFHTLNPRVYAQYKLFDSMNAYASAGKGFRSGGLNSEGQPSFGPEEVWTYELGEKSSLAEGRVSADVALFWSNYTNYQIVAFVPPPVANVITSNAGEARIKGVEWALAWKPWEAWTLSFSGDYLNTEFTKIDVAADAAPYAVGDPLDLFPKYELTVATQRDFTWNGRAGFFRLDYSEHAKETYRNRNVDGPGFPTPWYYNESDIIHMLNLHVGLRWNENLSLGFFAQNLLNDRGFLDPYSIESNAARARPRTYGVQFGVKFE